LASPREPTKSGAEARKDARLGVIAVLDHDQRDGADAHLARADSSACCQPPNHTFAA